MTKIDMFDPIEVGTEQAVMLYGEPTGIVIDTRTQPLTVRDEAGALPWEPFALAVEENRSFWSAFRTLNFS